MISCTGQPISWLTLERHHLGELTVVEGNRVTEHLLECECCQECMESIENDERILRPLPSLDTVEPRIAWFPLWLGWTAGASAVAAAAIVIFLVIAPFKSEDAKRPLDSIVYKGGELTLTLLREREGSVIENPKVYLNGDRFRLLLTCPGLEETNWDVVVFQGKDAYFPFARHLPVTCGNRVSLPGTFSLTGEEASTVCLVIGDEIPDRDMLSSIGPDALPEGSVCTVLEPVPPF